MTMNESAENPEDTTPAVDEEKALPFTAKVKLVPVDAPLKWIKLGAEDMKKAPVASLTYGVALTVLSFLIAYFAWSFGTLALYLGMATGFVLVGPVLAIGLYSFSRQIELGREPKLGYCLKESGNHLKNIFIYSFILLIVFLLWARSATAIHIFFPQNSEYSTGDLALYLTIGTVVGAVFSAIVFTTSAFSLPMLMDRKTDGVTAVITSINAVLQNKKTMLVWGGMIVISVVIGFMTLFLGFIVLLPLIGHATWHAYRDTIDASQWPENIKE